ncbi:sensor histidine kinase [Paenibacillus whitsoniae]|uniref:histidine kinase n=1 Tax=Paenibacillus whitsoniae TaxID=2496558 RepID=A0A430JGW9_9BACL|nr:sensor histidine kinase [Paenibacillus whitsoniae]RTE10272.1 sensor histidine kinase [Paenibacillus whitsoniae]
MKRKEIRLNRFLLLFSLTIVSLMLIIIGNVLYVRTVHYIDEKTDMMQAMKLNQTAADVRKQFEDIYQTIDSLRNNTVLIQSLDKLERPNAKSYEKVNLSQNIESSLFNLNKGNELISGITIWTKGGQYSSNAKYSSYYFEGNQLTLASLENQITFVSLNQTYQVFGLTPLEIQEDALRNLLDTWNKSSYFMCPIKGPEGTLGILTINLNIGSFNHILPYGESLAVVDAKDQVLFKGIEVTQAINELLKSAGNTQQMDGISFSGKRYFFRDIGFHDIRIALAETESGFHKRQFLALGGYALIILGGSALLTFFLSYVIGRKILFPLHSLISWIGRQRSLEERWQPIDVVRHSYKRFTMRDRLFVYFLITILLPICLFVTGFYVQSSKIITQELEQTFYTLFDKTAHRVELFADQKESAMTRLAYDAFVASYVDQPSDNLQQHMDQLIFDSFLPVLSEDAIGIYNINNQLIYSNRYKHANQIDPIFFEHMLASRKPIFYWLPSTDTASSTVSLGIGIVDINRYSSPIAYMKTDINGVFFTNLYADLNGNGSEAFIVDENGRIISHPDMGRIAQKADIPASLYQSEGTRIRTDSAIYFSKKIAALPWYVISKYDASAIRDQVIRLFFDDIYLLVILLLLILLFSYLMSQYLVQPLASIQNRYLNIDLEHVDQLTLHRSFAIDEVEQLRVSFNHMLERINGLVQDTLQANEERLTLEFEKKELHIEALQAQINPHFLYNTLENIIYMIEKGERHLAVDMIGLLSRLFRYAMGKDSPLTTLRDEMVYCQSYSKIMSYRYKNRIHFEWQMDESLNACIVNKMILQPIIENAIRHTLKMNNNEIKIWVSCRKNVHQLEVVVTDNGPGIEPQKLDEIRLRLDNRERGNVGLYNVNSRIKLHFGDAYGLSIDSAGVGTTVTIRLPYEHVNPMEASSHV